MLYRYCLLLVIYCYQFCVTVLFIIQISITDAPYRNLIIRCISNLLLLVLCSVCECEVKGAVTIVILNGVILNMRFRQ